MAFNANVANTYGWGNASWAALCASSIAPHPFPSSSSTSAGAEDMRACGAEAAAATTEGRPAHRAMKGRPVDRRPANRIFAKVDGGGGGAMAASRPAVSRGCLTLLAHARAPGDGQQPQLSLRGLHFCFFRPQRRRRVEDCGPRDEDYHLFKSAQS